MTDETTFYSSARYTPGQAHPHHAISPVNLTVTMTLPTGQMVKFATLTMIAVSMHRDTFPVTVMSRVEPVGFTRGHRMIAGTMVFSVFDRSAFAHALADGDSEPAVTFATPSHLTEPKIALVNMNADELPPFDVHMIYANEEGTLCYEGLRGVRIVDEGGIRSMELMQIQESFSYMAVEKIPLQPFSKYIQSADKDWSHWNGVGEPTIARFENPAVRYGIYSAADPVHYPPVTTATAFNLLPVIYPSTLNVYSYTHDYNGAQIQVGGVLIRAVNLSTGEVGTTTTKAKGPAGLTFNQSGTVNVYATSSLGSLTGYAADANNVSYHIQGSSASAAINPGPATVLNFDVTAPGPLDKPATTIGRNTPLLIY